MAERVVRARLQAVIGDFKKGMQEAAKSTEEVGDKAKRSQEEVSGLSRAGAAIGSAIKAGAIVGSTAVVGLGLAALKVGIAYNALEQSSRAALTTLLGSSEAATAQMEKLREFGKTSPFPRQVWIEAQQQLLAFGFAAGDIIPTFEAIQDAVAAAGGSSQDIEEIVRVLAQVQSTGTVTAEVLNQLGIRGIDAATLLGEAMGKTAAQIREDISSGALDASTFIETLTESMSDRFGGAAEGLKKTWVGATDRIKGAFRDIGSALAAPFVDPNGGGRAVEWANQVADVMRALEGHVRPLADALMQKAVPAFDAISDRLGGLAESIKAADVDVLIGRLEELAPAVAGLGTAALTAASSVIPFFDRFTGGINPAVAGIAAFVLTSPEMRDLLMQLVEAATPLAPPLLEIATILTGLLQQGLAVTAEMLTPLVAVVGTAVDAFTSLPAPLQTAVVILGTLVALRDPLSQIDSVMGDVLARIQLIPSYIKDAPDALGRLAGSARGLLGVLGGPWGLAIGAAVAIGGTFVQRQLEKKRATEELTGAIEADSGAMGENTAATLAKLAADQDLADKADDLGLKLETVLSALMGNADAQRLVETTTRGAIDRYDELTSATENVEGTHRRAGESLEEFSNRQQRQIEAAGGQREAAVALIESFGWLQDRVGEATEEQQRNQEATRAAEEALRQNGYASDESATATQEFGLAVQEATVDVDLLTESIQKLFETHWGAAEAADAQRSTLNTLAEQIATTNEKAAEADSTTQRFSTSLIGNSQQAVDNRETLRRLVEQTATMITEDAKAGLTKDELKAKTAAYKAQLEAELLQMGFNIDEVRGYTGVLDEVPDGVATTITVNGHQLAIQNVKAVQGVIDALKNKTVTITAYGISSTNPRGNIAMASGGRVHGPGTGTSDDIPAWLSNGEYVIKAASVSKYGQHMMDLINAGQFASGGIVGRRVDVNWDSSRVRASDFAATFASMMKSAGSIAGEAAKKAMGSGALGWARSQAGKPYLWGGVGPGGYDCSGFMSAIVNVIRGRSPYRRLFATGGFPTGDFARGMGNFAIGSRRGNPGHMAGTLSGTNVESRGGEGVVIGPRARGASNGLFGGNIWHLKGFAQGGMVGDPPFDQLDPRGLNYGVFDRGGRLSPGMLAYNGTGVPETVLSPDESRAFDALVRALTDRSGASDLGEAIGRATGDLMAFASSVRSDIEALGSAMGRATVAVESLATVAAKRPEQGTFMGPMQLAANELLKHIQGGGKFYEDFSFRGNSGLLSKYNDQLADMFYGANPGFDFGPSGTSSTVTAWLQQFLGGGGKTPRSMVASSSFDQMVANVSSMRPAPRLVGADATGREQPVDNRVQLTVVAPMEQQVDVIERRLNYRALSTQYALGG